MIEISKEWTDEERLKVVKEISFKMFSFSDGEPVITASYDQIRTIFLVASQHSHFLEMNRNEILKDIE